MQEFVEQTVDVAADAHTTWPLLSTLPTPGQRDLEAFFRPCEPIYLAS
jgi:hypothetical protein